MNRQFLILLPYYLRYGVLIIRENILWRRKSIPTPEKGIYKYMKVWNNTVFLGIISLIHLLNKHLLSTHGMPGTLLEAEDKRVSKTWSLPSRASTECREAGAQRQKITLQRTKYNEPNDWKCTGALRANGGGQVQRDWSQMCRKQQDLVGA